MEPIVCECGKPIGNLYDAFYFMRRKHDDEHILKSLRVTDLCCRKSFIGCVDFYKLRNGDYESGKRISDLPRQLHANTMKDDQRTTKKDVQNADSDTEEDEPPKTAAKSINKGNKGNKGKK